MSLHVKSLSGLAMLCAVLAISGCGGAGDGYTGHRGEVEGKVTYKGEPVPEGCNVMFQSSDGKTYTAVGLTKADGTFRLLYNGTRLLPGVTYKVQVTPPATNAPPGTSDADEVDPEAMKTGIATDPSSAPFPVKYNSVQTSGITFTVEEGKNDADIVLEE